jgi:hypothetical protein
MWQNRLILGDFPAIRIYPATDLTIHAIFEIASYHTGGIKLAHFPAGVTRYYLSTIRLDVTESSSYYWVSTPQCGVTNNEVEKDYNQNKDNDYQRVPAPFAIVKYRHPQMGLNYLEIYKPIFI